MIDGNPQSQLLVIAMAPGEEELEQNLPLVGPTGNMLWSLLGKEGLTRADCFMVNCIGEWPEKKSGPSPQQLAKYWDAFDAAVMSFTGEVVLLLGSDALSRFTGLTGGIESWRGYLVAPDELNILTRPAFQTGTYKSGKKKGQPKLVKTNTLVNPAVPKNVKWIIPTLHPAGVMRTGMTTLPALAADINRAVRAIRGELRPTRDTYTTIPEVEVDSKHYAFDIENPNGYVERIGFAGDKGTWTSSFNHTAKHVAADILSNPNVLKIAQNAPFDVTHLGNIGVKVDLDNTVDTMLMAVMLQPDLPKGLNYIASLYLDCRRWKHLSGDEPQKYNAFDASRELEIYHIMRAELEKTKQWDLFKNTIMPGVWTFMRMSQTGLYLDPVRRDKWVEQLSTKLEGQRAEWYKLHPTINPSSHVQLKKWLYDEKKCKLHFDKYGKLTVNELALIDIKLERPELEQELELLLDIRGLDKDLEVYAKVKSSPDGCVHPSYLPRSKDDDKYDDEGHRLGKEIAGTLRPTAKNPNIQNQTKEARFMYVARRKGYVVWEVDYTAFEARILAALSQDTELQRAIDEGLHKHNMELLGVDKTRAKNGFYGWSYGAGAPTLRKTFRLKGFDVPLRDCKSMLRSFDKKYHKAAEWRDGQIALARQRYYVENPFGLRRYFYTKSAGTAPSNTPIQSTAAIIMWKVAPELERVCEEHGALLTGMVHDSFEGECKREGLGNFERDVRRVMEREFPEVGPGFRVPIEFKHGPSWGEVA